MKGTKPIKVGDVIPTFSLKNQNDKLIDIAEYLGNKKLVIFFYPRDGSLNCSRQACYFRDINDIFHETGTELFGISEQSVESHRNFAESNRLNYHILSDTKNKVRSLFGVPSNFFGLIPGRVTYIVDLNGVVVSILNSQTDIQRHVDEALKICLLLKKVDKANA